MRIRPARPDEAELLTGIALRAKAYWGYDEAFMAACRAELTLDAAAVERASTVVAEDGDGRLLGFAALAGTAPNGELEMLFVEPDRIGRGIGRALFAHVRDLARVRGLRRLTIDADPNAEAFYLAMGAARIGSTPSTALPGRELPRLEVLLDRAP
ncbi:GNAT family N-acetyltransferase [Kitasatospora sp. NPDC089797]|uniref:GNAT family N-acetyltransferase n=1 Tax=Kitasatospora sp. NPDC089797 TaxID=3155298 RepID=UPI00341926BD